MSEEKKQGFSTRALHSAWDHDPATRARAVPIFQTVAYEFESAQQAANLFHLKAPDFPSDIYGRFTNPTNEVLEARIADLEGGVAAATLGSGQAATTLGLLPLVDTGENIVASNALYGGTYTAYDITFPKKFGINAHLVDPTPENVEKAIDDKTKAVFTEIIGNPKLNVVDIEGVAEVAHDANIPLIVDNTFATPYLARPIEHGADIVIHSGTKWISHGTSLGGLVIDSGNFDWTSGNFPDITEEDESYGLTYLDDFGKLAYIVNLKSRIIRDLGPTLSPFNAFLLIQGLETLPLRMERHSENAAKVVEYLQDQPKVEKVIYPGLKDHPTHDLARKYFKNGYGGMVGFEIEGGAEAGKKFTESLDLFSIVANVGETKSMVIHPSSTTHSQLSPKQQLEAGVTPGFIRFSIGLEDIDDIIADIDQALAKI